MSLFPATNPADQPILLRRLLRQQVAALLAETSTREDYGWTVQSPGAWPTPPSKMPAILVNALGDNKQNPGKAGPYFTSVAVIEVQGRVASKRTYEAAQDLLDELGYRVENAIFGDYGVNVAANCLSCDTSAIVDSENELHIGGFTMTLSFEAFEEFAPTEVPP